MLSSILFEAAGFGGINNDASPEMVAKYGYNSEHRIAMESTLELNDIFYESFYQMEELDFQHAYATMEGVSDSVLEGISDKISEKGRAAVAKVKDFLKRLWEKVKAFFHNVRRFLDGVFMNAQDFVKKYEKELNALKFSDKDYDVELYDYDIERLGVAPLKKLSSDLCSQVLKMSNAGSNSVEDLKKAAKAMGSSAAYHNTEAEGSIAGGSWKADQKKKYEEEKAAIEGLEEKCLKELDQTIISVYGKFNLKEGFSSTDLASAVWSACRNGAEDSGDKKTVTVKSLNEYITYLKTSKNLVSSYDSAAKECNTMFKTLIKNVENVEKALSNDTSVELYKGTNDLGAKVARAMATVASKAQSYVNQIASVTRSAIQEKIASYKKVCSGAFSHADKKAKDEK